MVIRTSLSVRGLRKELLGILLLLSGNRFRRKFELLGILLLLSGNRFRRKFEWESITLFSHKYKTSGILHALSQGSKSYFGCVPGRRKIDCNTLSFPNGLKKKGNKFQCFHVMICLNKIFSRAHATD
jgi:hypothetical protein